MHLTPSTLWDPGCWPSFCDPEVSGTEVATAHGQTMARCSNEFLGRPAGLLTECLDALVRLLDCGLWLSAALWTFSFYLAVPLGDRCANKVLALRRDAEIRSIMIH